jgi:hypothetical protein
VHEWAVRIAGGALVNVAVAEPDCDLTKGIDGQVLPYCRNGWDMGYCRNGLQEPICSGCGALVRVAAVGARVGGGW